MEQQQRGLRVAPQNAVHQLRGLEVARQSQRVEHRRAVDGPARRRTLVQKAQRVAQRAVGNVREQLRTVRPEVDALLLRDVVQPSHDLARQNAAERKALAARENGRGHLVQLGRRQNEHQVLRRLLQNFQQRVKRRDGEHVHLVDDVHTLFHLRGGVDGLVPQRTDVVHAVVRGGVELHHIEKAAGLDAEAALTFVAGVTVLGVLTVHRLGEDLCAGGFARAARAGEKVGVREPSLRDLPLQRFGDVLLPDHVGEGFGPPLAVQRLIHTTLPLS